MIPPTINNNGTSRDELLAQQFKVIRMLKGVLTAMSEAAPHGRDYQTRNDPQAHIMATEEHAQRQLIVRRLLAEYETIAEHIV